MITFVLLLILQVQLLQIVAVDPEAACQSAYCIGEVREMYKLPEVAPEEIAARVVRIRVPPEPPICDSRDKCVKPEIEMVSF